MPAGIPNPWFPSPSSPRSSVNTNSQDFTSSSRPRQTEGESTFSGWWGMAPNGCPRATPASWIPKMPLASRIPRSWALFREDRRAIASRVLRHSDSHRLPADLRKLGSKGRRRPPSRQLPQPDQSGGSRFPLFFSFFVAVLRYPQEGGSFE